MNQKTTPKQPQDIQAEAALLGSILLNPLAIVEIDDLVQSIDFFDKKHEYIYQAALSVYQEGKEVDILTVGSQLKNSKKFSSIGGNDYLNQLINIVPTAAHIKSYAQIIISKARRRGLIKASQSLNELAFDENKNLDQIIEEAELSLFNISRQHVEQNVLRLQEIMAESFEQLKQARENKTALRGLSSGFSNLDNFLAGFQKSDLIIIAARPGMGKTGFALNLAYNIAFNIESKQQNTVLYFSLEMSNDQLLDRLLSMHTGIDNWQLRTRHLRDSDFHKIEQAQSELAKADLYIDDTPGLNISEIRTKTRRLNYKQPVDLVVVDYLQLMRGLNPGPTENRVAEITEISRSLKLLAKELNIPVIALSQLSRQTETRESKQPALADLRDSGAIEQDADIVAFLYREEYYNPDLEDKKGLLEFQVKKHRNGPVGKITFYFNKEIQRYLVLDKESMQPADIKK
ncbi:MAG: replicative DNA helicase [Candidatus Saccharibacteria bacterium]|nr:replicative DNA helicase [Candidatus Saccharibacteria bacterium]MCY4089107.1 replicative DNA helicase [Candidatus Saccharibacteria bacterium]